MSKYRTLESRLIFRCRFYYYLGLVRPKVRRWLCRWKESLLLTVPRRGTTFAGPNGEVSGLVRMQRGLGKAWTKAFITVSMGRNERGRVSRLVWIISACSGIEGLCLVVCHLVLGWLGQKNCGLEYKSREKGGVGWWDLDWLVCMEGEHGRHTCRPVLYHLQELAGPGMGSRSISARPQDAKASE